MPIDYKKYPNNWNEIRNMILLRAGGDSEDPRINARCERCFVRNYSCRCGDKVISEHDSYKDARSKCPRGCSVVVLTIAHINNPDPMDSRPENLQALCQRCHNRLDAAMRLEHRRRRRQSSR